MRRAHLLAAVGILCMLAHAGGGLRAEPAESESRDTCCGAPAEPQPAPDVPSDPVAPPAPKPETAGDTAGDAPSDPSAPPASPFGDTRINRRPDARSGVVELSDGTKIPGDIYGTRGQALVVLDTARKNEKWRRVPWNTLLAIETRVEWQRMDRQWRFKTAGDPEKVFTGKTYPNRRYAYTVTLRDETQISGRIKGVPVYVRPAGSKPRMVVLHERHKGEVDTKLEDLVYVTSVRFGDDLRRLAEKELREKAEAERKKEAADGKPAEGRPHADRASKCPDADATGAPDGHGHADEEAR